MITLNYPEGKGKEFTVINYPAGEVEVRLTPETLKNIGRGVRVVARAATPQSLIELLMLCNVLDWVGESYDLILPYLPYGRNDRNFVVGGSSGLRMLGQLLVNTHATSVTTFDAHNPIAAKESIIYFKNIEPFNFFRQVIGWFGSCAIVLPDAGARAKYLDGLGFAPIFCAAKKRHATTGVLEGFTVPNLSDKKKVLIIDDLCDAGGTFNGIAQALREKGFTGELGLCVSHGIFSQVFQNLGKNFSHIFTTNSFSSEIKEVPHGLTLEIHDVMTYINKEIN